MKANTEQDVSGNLPCGPGLTKQQAEQIYEQGKEAVVFALLQQSQMLAQRQNLPAAIAADPSTPSAQKPVFAKDNKDGRRCGKKPGRKKGHNYRDLRDRRTKSGLRSGLRTLRDACGCRCARRTIPKTACRIGYDLIANRQRKLRSL